MNTLTILQNALRQKTISQARAVRFANTRLGGDWAVAQDTKRLSEKHQLIADLHGYYHETNTLLIPVRTSYGRAGANAWASRAKYRQGKCPELYTCQLTHEVCSELHIPKLTVLNENNEPIIVAGGYCERQGYIFRWNDGSYHTIRQPETRRVRDYHGDVRPRWWKSAEGIGMELEINCNDRDKLATKLHNDIMIERDGSLDGYRGVELIGGPYSCEQYQKGETPWEQTLTEIKNIGGEGHTATGFYGIHLSVSRSLFSTFHGAKFVVFFNQQKALCQLIAQRAQLYGHRDNNSGYEIRKKIKDVVQYQGDSYYQNTLRSHNNNSARKRTYSSNPYASNTSKYEPVKVDDKRYEVRIFRSNIRWERILKNIEFVDAVKEFTRDASADKVATPYVGTVEFLYWLGKTPGYNHLKRYLVDNASNFDDNTNSCDFKKRVNFKLKKSLEPATDL